MNANLKKRNGFTLVELLVALTCSILILGSITTSLLFIEKMNNKLINQTSNLYKLRSVEKYISNNYATKTDMKEKDEDGTLKNIVVKDGNVYCYKTLIAEKTLIIDNGICFNDSTIDVGDLKYIHTTCAITYKDGQEKTFEFIVDIKAQWIPYLDEWNIRWN